MFCEKKTVHVHTSLPAGPAARILAEPSGPLFRRSAMSHGQWWPPWEYAAWNDGSWHGWWEPDATVWSGADVSHQILKATLPGHGHLGQVADGRAQGTLEESRRSKIEESRAHAPALALGKGADDILQDSWFVLNLHACAEKCRVPGPGRTGAPVILVHLTMVTYRGHTMTPETLTGPQMQSIWCKLIGCLTDYCRQSLGLVSTPASLMLLPASVFGPNAGSLLMMVSKCVVWVGPRREGGAPRYPALQVGNLVTSSTISCKCIFRIHELHAPSNPPKGYLGPWIIATNQIGPKKRIAP